MKFPKLDHLDVKILIELQRHGRMTNQRLSEHIGLSARPCLERVRRLEEGGFIRQYLALLNLERLPDCVEAFAEITLKSQATASLAVFERRLAGCPEVVECHLVGGAFDYLAHIVCSNLERYNAITTEWIDDPTLPVGRIVSHFVMKTVRPFAGYPLDGASALIMPTDTKV